MKKPYFKYTLAFLLVAGVVSTTLALSSNHFLQSSQSVNKHFTQTSNFQTDETLPTVEEFPPSEEQYPRHQAPEITGRIIHDTELVQVLVDNNPVPVYFYQGQIYLQALKNKNYKIRLRNPYDYRVAVSLSVDGLNTIDGRRTSGWNARKWVIQPFSEVEISGWQVSNSRARKFYFTSEELSYAKRRGMDKNLGIISAIFYREMPQVVEHYTTPNPGDSSLSKAAPGRADSSNRAAASSSSGASASTSAPHAPSSAARHQAQESISSKEYAATGMGESINHNVRRVYLDLDPNPMHAFDMRYEFLSGLVEIGVIPKKPIHRREDATGFSPEIRP